MLGFHLDDDAVVCRLRSIWTEADGYPIYQSTDALIAVMKHLCSVLNASDASWLGINKLKEKHPKLPKEYHEFALEKLRGWFPTTAICLNESKTFSKVAERWFMHARRDGLDPLTRSLIQGVGKFRVCIREEVASDDEWSNHWIATKFLPYYGVEERMAAISPVSETCEVCVLIDRAQGSNPFTQKEKAYFQAVVSALGKLNHHLCLERGIIAASSPLSQREMETYRMLLTQKSESEIAEQMGLSAHTVHDYARQLYQKFGVKGRIGLMALVLEVG